jgi:large subunit ribosomal protein L4
MLKPYLSHLRQRCTQKSFDGRIASLTMGKVRTFFTTITKRYVCKQSECWIGKGYHRNDNIGSSIRYFSSTLPDPIIPQPKKFILPSNLVFDSRSHFLTMFETDSTGAPIVSNNKKEQLPINPSLIKADSIQYDDNVDEYNDDDELDEDEDDDDDDSDDLYMFDDHDALVFPYREGVVYTKPLPERLHVDIYTLFRSPSIVGSISLNESVFGLDPIRVDLLKRSVDYYRAKKRGRRMAKTKTIGEVSGSGRKIRNQKGGGIARAGHSRPPHFRGGAKAHGPKNITDYSNFKLNKKVRKLATRHVFSQKLKEGNLILLNHLHELPTHKTNDLAQLLAPWKIGGQDGTTALIMDHYDHHKSDNEILTSNDPMPSSYAGVPTNLHVAARNIQGLKVTNSYGANVHDILKHEKLLITLAALEQIEERLKL